jgi:hypothetical protein
VAEPEHQLPVGQPVDRPLIVGYGHALVAASRNEAPTSGVAVLPTQSRSTSSALWSRVPTERAIACVAKRSSYVASDKRLVVIGAIACARATRRSTRSLTSG